MSMPMSIPPKKSMSMGVSILLLISGKGLSRNDVISSRRGEGGRCQPKDDD